MRMEGLFNLFIYSYLFAQECDKTFNIIITSRFVTSFVKLTEKNIKAIPSKFTVTS